MPANLARNNPNVYFAIIVHDGAGTISPRLYAKGIGLAADLAALAG